MANVLKHSINLSFWQNSFRFIIDQKMSNFIQTKEQVISHPIIQNKIRKLVFNPHSFRNSLNTLPSCQQQRQKIFLKRICNRIDLEQREKIRILANQQARDQILNLKHKLRKNISNQNIAVMFGEKKLDHQEILSKVMKVPSEVISIDKLHRRQINLRLGLMEEAQTIINNKEEYQLWYNSNKNSNTSSPIFKKINFLLQKVSKKDNTFLKNTNYTDLLKPKIKSNYNKINRKKTEGCDITKW